MCQNAFEAGGAKLRNEQLLPSTQLMDLIIELWQARGAKDFSCSSPQAPARGARHEVPRALLAYAHNRAPTQPDEWHMPDRIRLSATPPDLPSSGRAPLRAIRDDTRPGRGVLPSACAARVDLCSRRRRGFGRSPRHVAGRRAPAREPSSGARDRSPSAVDLECLRASHQGRRSGARLGLALLRRVPGRARSINSSVATSGGRLGGWDFEEVLGTLARASAKVPVFHATVKQC
jgi:hypothetical protein